MIDSFRFGDVFGVAVVVDTEQNHLADLPIEFCSSSCGIGERWAGGQTSNVF